MNLKKKVMAAFAATCIAVGLGTAPQAVAADANLVAFGDSVLADPDAGAYLTARLSSQSAGGVNCPQSNNYARRTGAKLGLPVADFSCSGAVSFSRGPQMFAQVDRAIQTGALSPNTRRVLYTTGFNDTYNNPGMSEGELRRRFVDANAPLIGRIRAAAPNARIQIVGYPTIGSAGSYCLLHVGPAPLDHTFLPNVQAWENASQWMQVDLAARTGTEFLDLKLSTRDNGMCATADRRMWAGLVDFTAGDGNLPLHVNARGHEHAANVIAGS